MREARTSAEPTEQGDRGGKTPAYYHPPAKPSLVLLKAGTSAAVILCLVTALIHVLLVFLHVAPPNPLSRQYSRQINAWVFPLFEQNWRLFAPDPESVNRDISARTMHTAPDGSVQVSGWFDLTAVDNSAVKHNAFPSHTAQNTLRRAWSSYLETHGDDDQYRSERALMIQQYLTNIAAERITEHRGGAFESVQLRVITVPIAVPAAAGTAAAAPTSAETRYLPWWKVTSHGN
ncbi:hypothetical protein SAMN06272735_0060 [Streptomyces sp. TLI_55]|uniref:DUF5819 family protein n=1 Tax=Streptomyces sp. TLI_55 TaxID=1938861 RepID=UPI000BCB0EC0|nr:DUF5819 family protein [Streptomyces sp. TLI_55]SNX55648.1 hypothetical protein SAMN06272735_0060 [Streptomyces sp. TLI_55]